MEFTKEDRNLLVRVGRALREEIMKIEGPGLSADIPEHHRKLTLDRRNRLLRDERDLNALRKKLEAQMVPATVGEGG